MYGAMRTDGASSDWVRRCATVLSRSLDFGRKRGLIDSNPAKDAAALNVEVRETVVLLAG